jgi:hypothetical protein
LLLANLLGANTLGRLADAELLDPDKAYTAVELVNDLQGGLFSELKSDTPKIDPLRRQLQRAYLDILKAEFTPPAAAPGGAPPIGFTRPPSELRAIARQALGKLLDQLTVAKGKAKDPITIAHLEDLQSEIKAILDTDKK